jgi:hypothetical protein
MQARPQSLRKEGETERRLRAQAIQMRSRRLLTGIERESARIDLCGQARATGLIAPAIAGFASLKDFDNSVPSRPRE